MDEFVVQALAGVGQLLLICGAVAVVMLIGWFYQQSRSNKE